MRNASNDNRILHKEEFVSKVEGPIPTKIVPLPKFNKAAMQKNRL